jgi:hypothetical protein
MLGPAIMPQLRLAARQCDRSHAACGCAMMHAEWSILETLHGCDGPPIPLSLELGTSKMDLTLSFVQLADGDVRFGLTVSPARSYFGPVFSGHRHSWLHARHAAMRHIQATSPHRVVLGPLHLQYNTDVFLEATVRRMADSLVSILEAGLDNPSTGVMDLPVVPAPERSLILGQFQVSQVNWFDALACLESLCTATRMLWRACSQLHACYLLCEPHYRVLLTWPCFELL